ncbi:MAG: glycoside hydrolase family 15 protein [Candidatus Margulisbacteria bacterium]|nr:glycoside hydrolase family 15 protein [Candidatus Margulisiibacteriota bacterium]MBU1617523.1 glycoside hydrolase family 15 protein [Candidatus Margulisiibacteriota bacterium]
MTTDINYNFGLIGNCASAALVSPDSSIEWLCLPFFDSPSVFARLLDKDKGGHFKISGVGTTKIEQKYVPGTPILKTIVATKDGSFEINDYMPRYFVGADKVYSPSEVQRNIMVLSGKPKIRVELKAMPNYASTDAEYTVNRDHIKIASVKGDYNSFFLYSNLNLNKIIAGELIELEHFSYFLFSYHEKLEEICNDKIYVEYEKTKTYWLDWCQKTRAPRNHRPEVLRSAITLKLLTFQKTGAVVAAPTTSLPEIIGEGRNWDYRFCWVRDASMTIELYARLGHTESATRFMNFILNRLPRKAENIRVMYSISGEKTLEEQILPHLSGYQDSRPVRTGNQAYTQDQNDLYGELIEAIYTYFVINIDRDIQLIEEVWTVVRSLINQVERCWTKPDSGIWERRGPAQHYVHSKMMNWVAVDRAAKIARLLEKPAYVDKWSGLAHQIKEDILTHGWDEPLGSFVMHYGSKIYDASNLLMLHYGFLERTDPKMINTVRQSYDNLVKNDLAFRYIAEDDFGLPRNAFIVTTFWMINALYLIGEKEKAKKMFEKISRHRNKLGLYSEAIDITSGRLTGNFPQGYSHLAHIQTIFLLETDYDWSDVTKTRKTTFL